MVHRAAVCRLKHRAHVKMSEIVFLLRLVVEGLQQWQWEWARSSGRNVGGSRDAGINQWSSTKVKSLRLCTRRAGRGSPVSHTVRASVHPSGAGWCWQRLGQWGQCGNSIRGMEGDVGKLSRQWECAQGNRRGGTSCSKGRSTEAAGGSNPA